MKNKKGIATNNALNYVTDRLTMNNLTKFQFKSNTDSTPSRRKTIQRSDLSAVVCDECAMPLSLYGMNFIETYSNGRANILRCLCDLHADELEVTK